MDLPIKLPSDADVIAEEAARFRALSPTERVRAVCDAVHTSHFLTEHADRPDVAARLADESEALGRLALREFLARHDHA